MKFFVMTKLPTFEENSPIYKRSVQCVTINQLLLIFNLENMLVPNELEILEHVKHLTHDKNEHFFRNATKWNIFFGLS